MENQILSIQTNWTPKEPMALREIVDNECAKRALEVATVGGHCVVVTSTTGSPAAALVHAWAALAEKRGFPFKAHIAPVCPCGNFGNYKLECNCSHEKIEEWNRAVRERTKDAVMFVETAAPRVRSKFFGESDGTIFDRIAQIRANRTEPLLAQDGEELLRVAVAELGGFLDQRSILAVAATVAKMGYSPHIGAQHVAEAVQYVRSPFGALDGFEKIETEGAKS